MSSDVAPARDDDRPTAPALARDFELEQVRQAVRGIRFGEVRIIIQDGRVVQIDRVEEPRLRSPARYV